jgi:leucyl-tRNA synthetase
LAYESREPINWCPDCKTGLANEDLEDGKCERCGAEIEQKPIRQWVLRITDYAERLLCDLEKLPAWDESIKEMQRNWIGKSEGAKVKFRVVDKGSEEDGISGWGLDVFTTRPDTLFGCTYMVLSPEHELIEKKWGAIKNQREVDGYIKEAKKKTNLERAELNKDKTGVKIDGLKAINPVNEEEIPIFVADYVLINYGTGAIMAVPAHDERDHEFAQKYDIPIKEVVERPKGNDDEVFTGEGVSINSGFLDGLKTEDAKEKMIKWLEEKDAGSRDINYKLEDWVFSRQRYWGEPIPIVHCPLCGAVPVKDEDLPVELPDVESYEPTGTGESPLAGIEDWVNTKCPKCRESAKRETNTMPQWAGSSWYYLRFINPQNGETLVAKDSEKYWSPVDFYVGGAEHATRHLIYARFWHKFLYDIGVVNYEEPFKRLQHVGIILAEDGRKMSKRWGNVINPDAIVDSHGADTMRVYEMFMSPFSQSCAWSSERLAGARRFLERVWNLHKKVGDAATDERVRVLLHKTIKKTSDDIENFKFNTAVASMMTFLNEVNERSISVDDLKKFIQILAPFAPHIGEEMWRELGGEGSVFLSGWPEYDEALTQDKVQKIIIQVNGKLRDEMEVEVGTDEEKVKEMALGRERVKKWTGGEEPKKIISVPGKLINIVI